MTERKIILNVVEPFGVCHAIAVPDVRHKTSAESKSKSYSPGMRRWGTHIPVRAMGSVRRSAASSNNVCASADVTFSNLAAPNPGGVPDHRP
jgi:hypothetical protein